MSRNLVTLENLALKDKDSTEYNSNNGKIEIIFYPNMWLVYVFDSDEEYDPEIYPRGFRFDNSENEEELMKTLIHELGLGHKYKVVNI